MLIFLSFFWVQLGLFLKNKRKIYKKLIAGQVSEGSELRQRGWETPPTTWWEKEREVRLQEQTQVCCQDRFEKLDSVRLVGEFLRDALMEQQITSKESFQLWERAWRGRSCGLLRGEDRQEPGDDHHCRCSWGPVSNSQDWSSVFLANSQVYLSSLVQCISE